MSLKLNKSKNKFPNALRVLQEVRYNGIGQTKSCCSIFSNLPCWKRFINWLTSKLGGDQPPYIDQFNYYKEYIKPLSDVVNVEELEKEMQQMTDNDIACMFCHSKNLQPDPHGLLVCAMDWRGAPWLCCDCNGGLPFDVYRMQL